jgi:menaquinone-dependent protoporphyrinogen oxidase
MTALTKRNLLMILPWIASLTAGGRVIGQSLIANEILPSDSNGPGNAATSAHEPVSEVHSVVRRRSLVAYSGEFGSTAEIARAISDILRDQNVLVDVKSVTQVENVTSYDAVIVGSAIQYDRWMPQATRFVERHASMLKGVPVAFFFSCLTLSRKNEQSERQAQGYADKLRSDFSALHPLSVAGFAGVLDYSKFTIYVRPLARLMFAVLGVSEGDHREWDVIGKWAESIKRNPDWSI